MADKPGVKLGGSSDSAGRSAIIREDAVARRVERRSAIQNVTSNGTVAAATMVFAALLAVIVANTPAYEPVHHFFETRVGVVVGPFVATLTLEQVVNDLLMAVFSCSWAVSSSTR